MKITVQKEKKFVPPEPETEPEVIEPEPEPVKVFKPVEVKKKEVKPIEVKELALDNTGTLGLSFAEGIDLPQSWLDKFEADKARILSGRRVLQDFDFLDIQI